MPVVFVTTEVAPWSKVGGLGDVMSALPAALAARGHRVMTVAPLYDNYSDVRDTGDAVAAGEVRRDLLPELQVAQGQLELLLRQEQQLGEAIEALRSPDAAWPSSTAMKALPGLECSLQLSLTQRLLGQQLHDAKVAFVVHNGGYQGLFKGRRAFDRLGLPSQVLDAFVRVEVSWLRAGVAGSDVAVTVSPGYAAELLAADASSADAVTAPAQADLAALLAAKGLKGIINGLDTLAWDPSRDPLLPSAIRYTAATAAAGKAAAKQLLQRRLGLTVDPAAPLFISVGRLTAQKGLDVLLAALPQPCGLVALAGLRYGVVPIASSTGGLRDIVTPEVGYLVPPPGQEGDTAAFRRSLTALVAVVQAAVRDYGSDDFAARRAAAMAADVSWQQPGEAWEQLLQELKIWPPSSVGCSAARQLMGLDGAPA
eukprot:gene12719-12849_t